MGKEILTVQAIDGDPAPISLSLQATAPPIPLSAAPPAPSPGAPARTATGSSGLAVDNGLTVTSARVVITKIEFKSLEEEDREKTGVGGAPRRADGEDGEEADKVDVDAEDSEDGSEDAAPDVPVTPEADPEEDSAEEKDEKPDEIGAAETAESEDPEPEFQGPYVFDLLTQISIPPLAQIQIPSGIYKAIDFQLDKLDVPEEEPDPVNVANVRSIATALFPEDLIWGRSIVIRGTLPYGGALVDFLITVDLNEEVKVTGPNGIAVTEGAKANDIIIAFRVQEWFQGIDFQGCLDRGELSLTLLGSPLLAGDPTSPIALNNTLVITDQADGKGACEDIRDIVEMKITQSADLGKDIDADGLLDEDEDTDDDPEDVEEEEDEEGQEGQDVESADSETEEIAETTENEDDNP